MKTALVVALLLAIALPSFAELTQQDLDKISVLIDRKLEPIKQEITAIKLDIAEMKGKIEALEGKMATKDDIIAVRDEISGLYRWIIIMWITIILAIFGIPYLYGRADRERVRQLEADVRELIKLKAEVETLKAIREAEERRREAAMRLAEENPEFAEGFRRLGLI
jgi:outer membrane murein-binding lipoprotein Lpp